MPSLVSGPNQHPSLDSAKDAELESSRPESPYVTAGTTLGSMLVADHYFCVSEAPALKSGINLEYRSAFKPRRDRLHANV